MNRALLLRLTALPVFLAAVLGTAQWWVPAVFAAVERLGALGPKGDAIFAAIYTVGSSLMLPASWFQGASGFLYGPVLGFGVSWTLSLLSAWVGFELARGVLRKPIERRIASTRRFAAIDRALARRGLVAVILLRVSPMAPYNVISHALGLTGVTRRNFLLGTAIGSLFPAGAWTMVGASLSSLSALTTGEADLSGARWAVLAVTLVASVGLAWFAKRALADVEGTPIPAPAR